MAGHFEIETRSDGQFMFHLEVGSEPILTSEAYATKAACISGIDSVKKNASEMDRYRRTSTPDGRFRFGLDAANGQSIAGSRHYETAGARDDGIEFVMKNAPDAKIQDLT